MVILVIAGVFIVGACPWSRTSLAFASSAERKDEVLANGVVHRTIVKEDEKKRNVIHLLEVDFSKGARIENLLASDRMMTKESVSKMAARSDARAAVNASYFFKDGGMAGLLAMNGKLLAAPVKRRTAFGIGADNAIFFERCVFKSEIEFGNGRKPLDGINRPCGTNEVVLFTGEFGERTPMGATREYTVISGLMISEGQGNSCIPLDGFVLSSKGSTWLDDAALEVGQEVFFHDNLPATLADARLAVGGGPRLVRAGKVEIDWKSEGFDKSFAETPAPRTAIGVKADGRLLIVTVDGRQKGYSDGMSLGELAKLMIKFGAVDAVNMDGGGSTTIVVDGSVRNRPSDGQERAVTNSLAVMAEGSEDSPAYDKLAALIASDISGRRKK
jgi:exopolysaccharide biosynthesis protein